MFKGPLKNLATEFQNALFSAAARLKSKFCIIVKQDGTIVYHDRNFESVFPETSNRGMLMIDKLFNAKNIAPMEADKIYKALGDGRADTVFIDIPEENEIRRIIITVDPLPRPSGFFILRGRDYVAKKYEQKVGGSDDKLASVDPKNVATIAHILHTLPFGIYSSDADGNLLFANYKLESMLGYDQHEIANRKLTLYDLIPQTNTPAVEHLLLRDCEGDIYFTTRGGKQITLHVKQEITKDANGGVIGNVSIVSPAKGAGGAPVTGGNFDSGGGKPSPVDGRSETPSLLSGRTF